MKRRGRGRKGKEGWEGEGEVGRGRRVGRGGKEGKGRARGAFRQIKIYEYTPGNLPLPLYAHILYVYYFCAFFIHAGY